MNIEEKQSSDRSADQFDSIAVLRVLVYSIIIPNGLIVGIVGFTYGLTRLNVQAFDRFADGITAGFLMLWATLLIGGLSGSAIVGWITAKRYGTTTPLLLIIPFGLIVFPIYLFRPWEGIPPLGAVVVTLIVPLIIGTIGTIAGVLSRTVGK